MAIHPNCRLCDDDKGPCAFHGATSAKDLARAFATALREKLSVGFADVLLAAFAGLEANLPDPLVDAIARLDPAPLKARLDRLTSGESVTTDQLRELSATALALAILLEEQGDQDDAADDEPRPTPRARR